MKTSWDKMSEEESKNEKKNIQIVNINAMEIILNLFLH